MTVMGLISFTINGTTVSGAEGETILKVAQRSGIRAASVAERRNPKYGNR